MASPSQKILVIISGIPCAGKSHMTSLFQAHYKSNYTVLKIERDEIFSRVSMSNPSIGNNKRNKLITMAMDEIYQQFNTATHATMLIVDSCSGNDGIKQFIMDKAFNRSRTIVIQIEPKMIESGLDIGFYLARAKQRPPHYVFPKTEPEQIKELHKCYLQYTRSFTNDQYSVIDLKYNWSEADALF